MFHWIQTCSKNLHILHPTLTHSTRNNENTLLHSRLCEWKSRVHCSFYHQSHVLRSSLLKFTERSDAAAGGVEFTNTAVRAVSLCARDSLVHERLRCREIDTPVVTVWVQYWYFVWEMSSAWLILLRGSRARRHQLVTSAHIIKRLICTSTGSDSVIVADEKSLSSRIHIHLVAKQWEERERPQLSVCLLCARRWQSLLTRRGGLRMGAQKVSVIQELSAAWTPDCLKSHAANRTDSINAHFPISPANKILDFLSICNFPCCLMKLLNL